LLLWLLECLRMRGMVKFTDAFLWRT